MGPLHTMTILFISLLGISCSNNQTAKEPTTLQTQEAVNVINKLTSVAEFKEIISRENVVVIDIRTPEEIAEGKIEGALEMDFYKDNFQDQLKQLDQSAPIAIYCRLGGRSGQTATMMKEMGFMEVYDLDGGFTAWREQ